LTLDPALRDLMLATIPSLRAFAVSLTGSSDRADDLVQETLMRAIANIHRFESGTNLNAWLFTILRNLFHSEYRKRKHEVEDADGSYAVRLSTPPEQNDRLNFEDLKRALAQVPVDQREALLLVSAEGLSYEEAAHVCGVVVGTVKSRVNRARARLAQILALDHESEFGADPVVKAALQNPS
jgi:RNA polymerase sigma-70 factor, ECF subfamily